MKPLHLNLASRPYRDYRPVYAAVVVMSLLTARRVPRDVGATMLRLHAPESLRL